MSGGQTVPPPAPLEDASGAAGAIRHEENIVKKNEIKVGKHYVAKVSGQLATVRIDAENPRGGWDATNLRTNKKVHIKSAQRLRSETRAPDQVAKDAARAVEAVEKGSPVGGATVPTGAKKASKQTRGPKAAAGRPTGERGAKGAKRVSGLDAAAQVLTDAGEPLNTKTMVERMLAKGLWKTGGKTPAATIYAAILRECATKGNKSRFRKVDRGRFELVK